MNNFQNESIHAPRASNHMSIERFADRLGLLMRKMAKHMLSAERNYLTRGIITLPQLWVLHEIADAKTCPMLVISRNLDIKSSTVTGIMDRLVKLGLAKRYPSETDRRRVLAEVTPRGRRILEHIRAEKQRSLINAFGPLSFRERADYLMIIEKVANQIAVRGKNKRTDPSKQ